MNPSDRLAQEARRHPRLPVLINAGAVAIADRAADLAERMLRDQRCTHADVVQAVRQQVRQDIESLAQQDETQA